eukprot:m.253736 g.253736  ORF g.253736 m.253736 type:complete len:67 (+) comp15486_c2_seq6:2767-2967(+)
MNTWPGSVNQCSVLCEMWCWCVAGNGARTTKQDLLHLKLLTVVETCCELFDRWELNNSCTRQNNVE